MKIHEFQSNRILSKTIIEYVTFILATQNILQGKSKLLDIKSKYKQKWYEEFIRNIYEKNKAECEKEIFSGFDIRQGSYIGGIESLKLANVWEEEKEDQIKDRLTGASGSITL